MKMVVNYDVDDDDDDDDKDPSHERLKARPILWGAVGITQTMLTSGVIFGWASLLPVLKSSGADYTPEQFSLIFTAGAIGNYMTTLIFGMILDNLGPKLTGVIASILFAIGTTLCSFVDNYYCFSIGFFIVGFAGPGIQMCVYSNFVVVPGEKYVFSHTLLLYHELRKLTVPILFPPFLFYVQYTDVRPTLHLANLYPSSTGGTGAVYMSAQAAAFDGGTAIFAIVRFLYHLTGLSASSFFILYNIVPAWCLLTAIFVWPNEILETPSINNKNSLEEVEEYMGVGSPYLSERGRLSMRGGKSRNHLIDAPISVVVKHPAFWALATWAGIHILKLNFIVATINDQLDQNVSPVISDHLIDVLGAMLPFGFVALPLIASILDRKPIWAFELANAIGVLYGAVLAFFPGSVWLQTFIVFPSVACSRQLVYSTLFHQVGASFGFANYGVLLGLINVMVSAFSTIQTPLVKISENEGSYYWANFFLFAATFPFFLTVLFSNPSNAPTKTKKGFKNEKTGLLDDDSESGEPKKHNSTGNLKA
ncbi:MAG: MFS family permease [Bacillariaceae sp.]|jgi:MFS family permease